MMEVSAQGGGVHANDDLFHRLETAHFLCLFTGEGDMENTGQGNTEPRLGKVSFDSVRAL
jgi:hypothetical protein